MSMGIISGVDRTSNMWTGSYLTRNTMREHKQYDYDIFNAYSILLTMFSGHTHIYTYVII